ncbi:hypothetical protein, partial [Polynucleobacter sp. 39-46-10]
LVLFPVPLKEKKTSQMWCLNWPHMFPRNKLQKSINYLVEPKKENTQKFVDFVSELRGEDKQAVEALGGDLFVRYMGTTNQCRLQFVDANENYIDPPKNLELRFDAEL